jgi:hypothetical protein
VAYSQEDRLAAVVLHALVSLEPEAEPVTLAQLLLACERDPDLLADRQAVLAALESLVSDGLAERLDALYKPTRAAIRAYQLSF